MKFRRRFALASDLRPLTRAMAVAAASCLGLFSCDSDGLAGGQPERLTPRTLSSETGAEAWVLFDRDSRTKFSPGAETEVELTFEGNHAVQAVKVFGTSSYALRLLDSDGDEITEEIDLREGDQRRWNLHPLPEALSLSEVTLALRAYGDAGEVGDLELWAAGPGRPIDYVPGVTAEPVEDRPAHVDVVAATPDALSLGPEGEAELCGAFRFELPRHPGAYRRMWLRASIAGAHRPFALTRALNEHSMLRAHWVPSETSRSYVQPIDPELLFLGANEVHYCVPEDAESEVTIDSVEIVGELDHGSNFIESATVAPEGANPTRSAAEILAAEPTAVTLAANEELVLAFDRLVALDGVLLGTAAPAEWKVRCVDEETEMRDVGLEASDAESEAGDGMLRVTSGGGRCAGVRVSHSGGGVLNAIRVFGSGAARRIDFPQIVLASLREHFGYEAWVEGWARAPSNVGGGARLMLDGEDVGASPEGLYGQMLTRSSAPNDAWVVTVSARFADGSESSRDFVLDGSSGALPGSGGLADLYDDGLTETERAARYGTEGQTASRTFRSGEAGRVALGTHVSVDIPEGAIQGQTEISITQLGAEDIPALDPGMINVTAPFARGYEYLPHGQRFQKAVTITLPYQENLIPSGYTGHDVETWFHNEELGHWEKLARAEVDPRNGTVRSLSDHFTVMINAVVVTPEHPQINSFDGNRISGLEAANPAAGIATIAPPEPNNRGDAVLSYPLAVPPGRLGMQPELAITYNSSAGNGWLGVGWDLGVSTISVDTRRGVPRYEAAKESETYLLDGQQLTPDANALDGFAERDVTENEKEFRPRVEGAFQRIIRRDHSPKRFSWEVTSRTGVTFRYGDPPAAPGAATDPKDVASLRDGSGNVYRWALREIEDLHGNKVRFEYQVMKHLSADLLVGRELYLRAVHYTLAGSSRTGVYQVHFCSEPRADVILNGRGGFKEEMRERLRRVEVHYVEGASESDERAEATACTGSAATTQVRAWDLEYQSDLFGKSQLVAIRGEGLPGADAPWSDHVFQYFNDLPKIDEGYRAFAERDVPEYTGTIPDSGFSVLDPFMSTLAEKGFDQRSSMLGGNLANTVATHIFAGFDPTQPTKDLAFGVKLGTSFSQTEGVTSLVDVDGDDLPDRVFCNGRTCFYNRNLMKEAGRLEFELEDRALDDIGGIFRERSFDFNIGPEVHIEDGSFYSSFAFSFTRGVHYLSDVNADGYIDVVSGSNVKFGRPAVNAAGEAYQSFAQDSRNTPVEIGSSTATASFDLESFRAEYESKTGPVDTLRMWQAPHRGTVNVKGLLFANGDPAGDGCDASIEQIVTIYNAGAAGDETVYETTRLFRTAFERGDVGWRAHDLTVDVSRGDFLVFRVHARKDGIGDRLVWDPSIEYESDGATVDENDLRLDRFSASEDFVLAGRSATLAMPFDGSVRITASLKKKTSTTDDLDIQVVRGFDHDDDPDTALSEYVAKSVVVDDQSSGVTTVAFDADVSMGDTIRLFVKTDSPIDLGAIEFEGAPTLTYVAATDEAGTSLEVTDAAGAPIYVNRVPFDMSVYQTGLEWSDGVPWVPSSSGTYTITANAWGSGTFHVTAKSDGKLLYKAEVEGGASVTFPLSVASGQKVYFSMTGTVPGQRGSVWFSYPGPDTNGDDRADPVYLPWRNYFIDDTLKHLPQRYRGWTYGAYKPATGDTFDVVTSGEILLGDGDFDEEDEPVDPDPDAEGGEEAAQAVFDSSPSFENSAEDRRPPMRPIAFPEPCEELIEDSPIGCEAPTEPHWVGPEDAIYVTRNGIGTSLLGPDAASVFATNEAPDASGIARGTVRISRGKNVALGGGYDAASIGAGFSFGNGVQDFFDLNGDGFPDIVTRDHVAFSMPHGGLGDRREFQGSSPDVEDEEPGDVRRSRGMTISLGAGASIPRSKQNVSGTQGVSTTRTAENAQSTRGDVTFGLSIGGAASRTHTREDLIDVNGDGLPDRVRVNGIGENRKLEVRLSIGYGFAPEFVEWTGSLDAGVQSGSTRELNFGVNLGYSRPNLSYGGGMSVGLVRSTMQAPDGPVGDLVFEEGSTLLDLNGDGLADIVKPGDNGLMVRFNHGGAFGPEVGFAGLASARDAGESDTLTVGRGGYFSLGIGPICVGACYLILNPGINESRSLSRSTVAVRDVDGDGLADIVRSRSANRIDYAQNLTGRTGLLKRVLAPIGAEIALDYQRKGNTQAMPQSRWVLSTIAVFDGLRDSPEGVAATDYRVQRISYANGNYDRNEREFLGFRDVLVEDLDTTGWDGASSLPTRVLRKSKQTYLNGALHERGLLVESTLEGDGKRYRRTVNVYGFLDPTNGKAADPEALDSIFPGLMETHEFQSEGNPELSVERWTEQTYGAYGNVETFEDHGGADASDDLVATIEYASCPTEYVVSLPNSIVVKHGTTLVRQRTADARCDGLVHAVTVSTGPGTDETSTTTLDYDDYGRLKTVTYPKNEAQQAYFLTYDYDTFIGAHVTSITDALGFTSTASYDPHFGAPTSEIDIHGQAVTTTYDEHGRPETVTGPYQQGSSEATIEYFYHPSVRIETEVPAPSWAQTSHHDIGRPDRIETYSFVDGLGRAVQTKKDGTIHDPSVEGEAKDVVIVSGRVHYDPLGRVIKTWNPQVDGGAPGDFLVDAKGTATEMEYDALDRVVKTILPASATTDPSVAAVTTQLFTVVPATGPDAFGNWSNTTVIDATGATCEARRDARGRIRQVIEHGHEDGAGPTGAATTQYEYDALDQLVQVFDAAGNVTTVGYDLAGRRTRIDNPDTGLTVLQYDPAGNVVARQTAALRARNQSIRYGYNFTQLTTVDHPDPEVDIVYTWGAPGGAPTDRNRITRIDDAAGSVTRHYGRLGEVVEETRFLAGRHPTPDEGLTTRFVYDTWGRLRQMSYPDGEVLTYGYDAGGLVNRATGVKLGTQYPYVQDLHYDVFGQRVYMKHGNGIVSRYAYDDTTRRLARLTAGDFQRLEYTYDLVGNVKRLLNDIVADSVGANEYGGKVDQSFEYDGLHRLTHAEGVWYQPQRRESRYSVDLDYNVIHNITLKDQHHTVVTPGGAEVEQRETTYKSEYAYPVPLAARPHAPTQVGLQLFSYDASGRLVTRRTEGRGPIRTILWDSEDRIQAIQDGGEAVKDESRNVIAGRGRTTEFVYDAAGQRVFKRGAQGETAYVNPYYTLRNGTTATKHFFVGASRLTSKLVPGSAEALGAEEDELSKFLGRWWEHRNEDTWDHARNVEMNPHYRKPSAMPSPMGLPESNFVYFYHPDHLGSTSFVTDGAGDIYEHVQYTPHGELWADERTNTERLPYLFTGKEMDQETGLYDFGARMYDPRVGLWASPDPILMTLLSGAGAGGSGAFDPSTMALYSYVMNHPLGLIDPDGRDATSSDGASATIEVPDDLGLTICVNCSRQSQATPGAPQRSGQGVSVNPASRGTSGSSNAHQRATASSGALQIGDFSGYFADRWTEFKESLPEFARGVDANVSMLGGPGVGGWGWNFERTTSQDSGLYYTKPVLGPDNYGIAAGGSVGLNFAIGDRGATWSGVFHNVSLGLGPLSVTYFWGNSDGPIYRGVAVSAGLGFPITAAHYDNDYVPKLILPWMTPFGYER